MPIDINAGSNIPLSGTPAPPQITENPLDDLGKLQAWRNARQNAAQNAAASAQDLQSGALKMQEQQRQLDQTQAVNDAYRNAIDPSSGAIDSAKLTSALAAGGHGSAAPAIAKSIMDAQKSFTDLQTEKEKLKALHSDAGGRMGAAVTAAGGDPNIFRLQGNAALASGSLEPADTQGLQSALAQLDAADKQDPTGAASKAIAAKFAAGLIAASPEQQKLASEKKTSDAHMLEAATAQANSDRASASQPAIDRKNQLEGDELQRKLDVLKNTSPTAVMDLVDQVVPPGIKENGALNARTKAQVVFALGKGDVAGAQDVIKQAAGEVRQLEVATDPRVQAGKVAVTVAQGAARNAEALAGTTDDDFARAGEEYERTGVMPALGMSSAGRTKILHAGKDWERQNGLSPSEVVTMQAAYKGDVASLKKFQGTRDQIVSFEDTAGKNLDLFLNAAAKIPDSGSPWVNTPLRMLDAKVVGSANMAAVNAARQVANNEIAKVTSGGGLSGVLSDSARKEVMDYNPKDATFAQTKAVAQVLKQDMANRHQAMDATLGDIKARIGGGSATPAAPDAPVVRKYNPVTGKLE